MSRQVTCIHLDFMSRDLLKDLWWLELELRWPKSCFCPSSCFFSTHKDIFLKFTKYKTNFV